LFGAPYVVTDAVAQFTDLHLGHAAISILAKSSFEGAARRRRSWVRVLGPLVSPKNGLRVRPLYLAELMA